MHAYYARKRQMVLWALVLGVTGSLVLATVSPIGAIAAVFGTGCGIVNALLSMRGNERLADHRNVGFFVLSSILRIVVFGIVPVEFALHGPWWTMAPYFIGFFLPLALYAVIAAASLRTGTPS